MIGKVQFLVRETGNLFAVSLEGMRRAWDVKHWCREWVEQSWFLTKVTSLPAREVSRAA